MPNNKSIRQCKWCDEYYCANCSSHSGFESYCSVMCERAGRIIDKARAAKKGLSEETKKRLLEEADD